MNFGSKVKHLRTQNNMTQDDLAKILKVARATVGRYENNERFPDQETLKAIADYFDVSTDYLLGRTNTQNNTKSKLSEKDKRDIAKHLEETMKLLEEKQDSIMFDGEAIDEETKELLKQSLENSMRMAKAINKKYTPKKYRK